MPARTLFYYLFLATWAGNACSEDRTTYRDWRVYAGAPDASRYSALDQINTANAGQLIQAWEYHTGDPDTNNRGQIQCNPIVIDSVLYGTT